MEIPGYEDTFFENVSQETKERYVEGKRKFEQTKNDNIARNEEMSRKSRLQHERTAFISHCIKLSEKITQIDTSEANVGSSLPSVDKSD